MAGTCWFYMTETRRRVAVPDLDFLPLISAGVITAETMVWTEGLDRWLLPGSSAALARRTLVGPAVR